MGMTGICEILIITLLVVSMVVPLAVVPIVTELITRRRVLEEVEFVIVDHSIYMHLHTSRRILESEIHTRLVGRILGILYWAINVVYLIEESQIVVRYYFRYLLSQDANTMTQVQVVEIVLSYLVIVIITILFVLDAIVSLCITFRQEKSLLKPHMCTNCQQKKWRKIKLNSAVHVGTTWLKAM